MAVPTGSYRGIERRINDQVESKNRIFKADTIKGSQKLRLRKSLTRKTRCFQEFEKASAIDRQENIERKVIFGVEKNVRRDMSEAVFDPDRLYITRLDPRLNTKAMMAHQSSMGGDRKPRSQNLTKLDHVSKLVRACADRPSLHPGWSGVDPDANMRDPDSDIEEDDEPNPNLRNRPKSAGNMRGEKKKASSQVSAYVSRRARSGSKQTMEELDLTSITPDEAATVATRLARQQGRGEEEVAKAAGEAAGSCVIANGGNIEEARVVADKIERDLVPGLSKAAKEAMKEEETLTSHFQQGSQALKNGDGHGAVMWFDACLVIVNKYHNEPRVNKYLRKAYRGMLRHEEAMESIKDDRYRSSIVIIPGCKGMIQQGTCAESLEEMSLRKQLWAHVSRHKSEIRLFASFMKEVVATVLDLVCDKTFEAEEDT